MLKVKFNMVKEFCEEILNDKDNIDRKIVRVTKSFTPSRMSPNIHIVSLLAGYSVSNQLVYLNRYCGEIWGINTESDKKIADKAEVGIDEITSVCLEAGLEIRAGLLENGKDKKC